nr:hypothetical protein [Tanacetum cinerariifolium]
RDGKETSIVMEAEIGGHHVQRMRMVPATAPLLEFNGEVSWLLGQISLKVSLGEGGCSTSTMMNFMVFRSSSPFNGIIRWPSLIKIQAVPSTAHGMLKFPMQDEVVTLHSNPIISADYIIGVEILIGSPTSALEAGFKVAIYPEYPEQTITIGGNLCSKIHCGTLPKSPRGMSPNKAEEKRASTRMRQGHSRRVREISFPPLTDRDGKETSIVMEAEIGGHHKADGPSNSPAPRVQWRSILAARWPSLRKIQAVPSTAHGMLKFPMQDEVVTLHSNLIISADYIIGVEIQIGSPTSALEAGFKVAIYPKYPEQTITIGGNLLEKGRMKLYDLLRNKLDIFS